MKFITSLIVLSGLAVTGLATPVDGEAIAIPAPKPDKVKRFATNTLPASSGHSALSAAKTIAASASFDGKMYRYDRGVSCSDGEGGQADAVFVLNSGSTLKNVIIGANQKEGVHCLGPCTIQNVWWADVCEDALTIKQSSGTSYIIGGGAFHASDKVVQHNGGGTVSIKDFYVQDFGKVYRSCGNCDTQYTRYVTMSGVWAVDGSTMAGVNSNYGDKATIADSCADDVNSICDWYQGNDDGDEPTKLGSGISSYCVYTASEVDDCP